MMRKTSMALAMAGGLAGAWAMSAQAAPTRVDGGRIEGVSQDGVTAYKGVPYAQAPVGALRWTPPKRVKA